LKRDVVRGLRLAALLIALTATSSAGVADFGVTLQSFGSPDNPFGTDTQIGGAQTLTSLRLTIGDKSYNFDDQTFAAAQHAMAENQVVSAGTAFDPLELFMLRTDGVNDSIDTENEVLLSVVAPDGHAVINAHVSIRFEDGTMANYTFYDVDPLQSSFRITAVPEPAYTVLFMTGLGMMAIVRRRRKG
jgi:hypothetical protein